MMKANTLVSEFKAESELQYRNESRLLGRCSVTLDLWTVFCLVTAAITQPQETVNNDAGNPLI